MMYDGALHCHGKMCIMITPNKTTSHSFCLLLESVFVRVCECGVSTSFSEYPLMSWVSLLAHVVSIGTPPTRIESDNCSLA